MPDHGAEIIGMTLTEFLLARIAEDEVLAHRLGGQSWSWEWADGHADGDRDELRRADGVPVVATQDHEGYRSFLVDQEGITGEWLREAEAQAPGYEAWSEAVHPARVLAECEAKRQIVTEHAEDLGTCGTCAHEDEDDVPGEGWVSYTSYQPYPCRTLRLLALPYAEHPDYRKEWKP